ncbi:hypothetical protein N658DRAFT_259553 [Parathielavia hyrcaniae]|uniref:Uncharacterized protein n=1 Tax=Parathielavia hyrcaniae TaxID=113614 RepID=A0AAN6PTU4_9PEZI|nr:hypothetical protein N658DRAFT_259553 [Parathielavia hyrcaniae]
MGRLGGIAITHLSMARDPQPWNGSLDHSVSPVAGDGRAQFPIEVVPSIELRLRCFDVPGGSALAGRDTPDTSACRSRVLLAEDRRLRRLCSVSGSNHEDGHVRGYEVLDHVRM